MGRRQISEAEVNVKYVKWLIHPSVIELATGSRDAIEQTPAYPKDGRSVCQDEGHMNILGLG